ncbi:hypothetical protein JW859_07795 [bacterium]|nr:hypothetical protein [bacterium]
MQVTFRALALGCVVCALLAGPAAPAVAQDSSESLMPLEEEYAALVELASTYQSGFLEVVALSCFQIYASTGIIATDFSNGFISADTALNALDKNRLLHSSCYTSLQAVIELTPPGNELTTSELNRLMALIEAEDELLVAVATVFAEPTDANAAVVETARARVEKMLDTYTQGENPVQSPTIGAEAR